MSNEESQNPSAAVDPEPAEEHLTNDSIEPSAKPWWRRASTWIVGVAVIIAGAAGAWLVMGNDSSTTTSTVAALKFAEVERTALEDVTALDGTLGFVAGDPLVYAGSPDGIVTITAGAPGTITSITDEGTTVEEGEILYTRDEQPVIVFYGEIPAYRTLNTRTTDGTDVLQLEEALTRLGYDEDEDFDLDGDFTYATKEAIDALQEDLGIDETGALQYGSYVFVDGPIFVAETLVDIGSPVNTGTPVIATSTVPGGTVTAVASEGDVLDHGDTLFVVEGDPVTLFVTDVPFYRTLAIDSVGDDVRVLEEALATFGFDADGTLVLDDVFDEATTDALIAWQASIGAPVDGVLNIGEIMVTEDPIRIAASHISIGSNVTPGTPIYTPSTSTSVVSVRLPADDQELIVAGDSVTVVMPNGDNEPASVTTVGNIAIRSQEFGTYFEVEITLDRQGAATGLDEAPVDVEAINDRVEGVLVVPVTALLALGEGGYAVQIDEGNGQTRLIGVEAGMYADGSVEVISTELEPGMKVVIP
ncbi:MAG: peptidoglycan-binding protein [Actinomycetota bacterium]|nr:peptidoglycan-binding protein [Actinomycetota bacterium]